MKWLDFLNLALTEQQIETLRCSLKAGARVYFYGEEGSGKSTIVDVLRPMGYRVSEPGCYPDKNKYYVPNIKGLVAFCTKKSRIEETLKTTEVSSLLECLKSQSEEIKTWVNSGEKTTAREPYAKHSIELASKTINLTLKEADGELYVLVRDHYEKRPRFARVYNSPSGVALETR